MGPTLTQKLIFIYAGASGLPTVMSNALSVVIHASVVCKYTWSSSSVRLQTSTISRVYPETVLVRCVLFTLTCCSFALQPDTPDFSEQTYIAWDDQHVVNSSVLPLLQIEANCDSHVVISIFFPAYSLIILPASAILHCQILCVFVLYSRYFLAECSPWTHRVVVSQYLFISAPVCPTHPTSANKHINTHCCHTHTHTH